MFKDRADAGMMLAKALKRYIGKEGVIVLAIPRGGLAVGAKIADVLHCPLDVIVAKKIPHPSQTELALGAVGEDGEAVIDAAVCASLRIPQSYLDDEIRRLAKAVQEKAKRYHGKMPALKGKIVILTDDGIATGSTMLACIRTVRKSRPAQIVVALPLAPQESLAALRKEADAVVCLETPSPFFAVGQGYQDFAQVEDDEAIRILHGADSTQISASTKKEARER